LPAAETPLPGLPQMNAGKRGEFRQCLEGNQFNLAADEISI
jgi:hypothetical protein